MTAVSFYVYDSVDQTADTPVQSVQVRLYSSDGATFVTSGTTDSSGNLTLDVPDATYWVRFFKTGYSFASKKTVVVDTAQTNEFDVEATNLEILPPSTAENLCRASGYVVDAGGQPRQGATLQFMLPAWRHIVGTRAITAAKVITRSDEYGYVEVELIQGAFYEVVVEGMDDQVFVAQVPEAQSANIVELIWPYPARVELSAKGAVSLSVGDTTTMTATLVLSSGVEMPLPDDAPLGALSFSLSPESSDEAVVTAALVGTTLTLTGVAAGSATISFSASKGYEERLPALTISFDTISVTVT